MSAPIMRIDDVIPASEAVRLIRTTLSTKRPKALHGHDFYELIWVQNGRMRHHLEDRREDLAEGHLLFIRPRDTHAVQGLGEAALAVTILFRAEVVEAIGRAHPALAGRLFWSDEAPPETLVQDARQMAELNRTALLLERGRTDALEAEAFLLPLVSRLIGPNATLPRGAPAWLLAACEAARDPAVFRDGAAGFARAAGKAHAHVSRTAQTWLGQSPTEYVNAQRMAFAARRLIGSDDRLPEIAADCGIPNLSHFHKLFRQTYGVTPQKFRTARQRELVQPD